MEAQEFFQGDNCHQPPPYAAENRPADTKAGDHFMVEDLLDFTNDDGDDTTAVDSTFDSSGSSAITAVDGSNSSFSGPDPPFGDPQFSGDLCVPCDELAELEWLSNFVEESFSNEDFQKLQLNSGPQTRPAEEGSEIIEFQPVPDTKASTLRPESPVPGKARSKRSRAVQGAWISRLLLSSADSEAATDPTAASKKTTKASAGLEKCSNASAVAVGDGRRCLHCATDKTPQWRTGPMGPKTLCNACGVRYKSGHLVPEYRPASSPTFVLTKHSNSHRKVMELRRQKELMRSHRHPNHPPLVHHHESMVFDVTNGEDYLIHHHVGPDFRQMI